MIEAFTPWPVSCVVLRISCMFWTLLSFSPSFFFFYLLHRFLPSQLAFYHTSECGHSVQLRSLLISNVSVPNTSPPVKPALGKCRPGLGKRKEARRSVSHKPCDQHCVSVISNCLSRLLAAGLLSVSECCLPSEPHYYIFQSTLKKIFCALFVQTQQ